MTLHTTGFAYSFYGTHFFVLALPNTRCSQKILPGALRGTELEDVSNSLDDGNATTCDASGGVEESNRYKQLCQVNIRVL